MVFEEGSKLATAAPSSDEAQLTNALFQRITDPLRDAFDCLVDGDCVISDQVTISAF